MKFEKRRLEPLDIGLCGKKYPARMTFRGMLTVEELLGEAFFAAYNRFALGNFTSRDVQVFLYACLKEGGVEVELADLDDLDFSISTIADIDSVIARGTKIEGEFAEAAESKEKKT